MHVDAGVDRQGQDDIAPLLLWGLFSIAWIRQQQLV